MTVFEGVGFAGAEVRKHSDCAIHAENVNCEKEIEMPHDFCKERQV